MNPRGNTMRRDLEFDDEKEGATFWQTLRRTAEWLRDLKAVSVAARLTLFAGMAQAAYFISTINPYVLGAVALTCAWKARNRINFGSLMGSAKWESERALKEENMLGMGGLPLGRVRPTDFSYRESLRQLFTKPWSASESVVRLFVGSLSKQRIRFSAMGGEIISAPWGTYTALITCAPPGKGKGVGVVIPTLLTYPFSVVTIDLKGENFKATAARRAGWSTIVSLDPFGITGAPSARLNPLDAYPSDSPTLVEDLRALAEDLVVKTGKESDPHWNESATNLILGLMLLVCMEFEGEERSLNEVRRILSNPDELRDALDYMRKSRAAHGMLARYGGMFWALEPKELSSVVSTANRQTSFLDSKLVADSIAATTFDLRAIKSTRTSVYLVLPVQYATSHGRLIRLWINAILTSVKQGGAGEDHELLMLLDEVAQLGEMDVLEKGVTVLRGFGVRFWYIVQSLSQLEVAYPGARYKTLLASFPIQQFFGISDYETAKYVSSYIGKETAASPNIQSTTNRSTSGGGQNSSHTNGSSQGTSYGAIERDLVRPEEVIRAKGVIILRQGEQPILASRLTYYTDPEFRDGPGGRGLPPSWASKLLCLIGVAMAFCQFPATWTYLTAHGATSERAASINPRPYIPSAQAPRHDASRLPADAIPAQGKTVPEPPIRPRDPVEAECPHCRKFRGPIPSDYAGEELSCPKCGLTFIVNLP